MNNYFDILKNRRNCRLFTDEPVDKEGVRNLMRAALLEGLQWR